MADFTKRSSESELMDDFSLGPDVIYPIMDELEVINKLLGGHKVFSNAFKKLQIRDGMIVGDWGCGGGDSLRLIADWARKTDVELDLVGIDATESAIFYATQKAIAYPEISFIKADVLSGQLKPEQFDIVISSLFTHHFDNKSWVQLIKKMLECSKYAVVINDLCYDNDSGHTFFFERDFPTDARSLIFLRVCKRSESEEQENTNEGSAV